MTTDLQVPDARIVSCGDITCEFLVDPIPRPKPPAITVNTKPAKREVVLMDNHKPNSMAILRGAQAILRERGIPVRDEIRVKLNPSAPFSAAELDEIAAEGGLILVGVSDCGSCSASSARDSILLQQRGAAGIAILTEPFASQVDRVASYYETDRDVPVIVLDHPMQNLSADELLARSTALADAAEGLLNAE
ncbi:UGSC family (seleno)protein [Nocardia sp. NPDC055029]